MIQTNIMQQLIQQFKPFIIAIIMFLFFNIGFYIYLLHLQKEKEKLMLTGYLDSVGSLLFHDLTTVFNKSSDNKTFFLFKNFSRTNNGISENTIKNKPYTISIRNSAEDFIFDLQELRENLNRIFPNFIGYAIIINDYSVAFGLDYKQNFNIIKDYQIDLNTVLTIKVGVNKNSSFYLLNRRKIYKNTLITAIATFFICLLFLYLYLKITNIIEERLSILEHDLHEERKINNTLLSNKKINQKLKKLFIKKATEMYIKQEMGIILGDEKIIQNISPSDYLFPMCLYDTSPEKINIVNLTKSLKEYFSPYFIRVALKIKKTIDTININCATEVFYQLIFSLIFNLMEFMDRQSEVPKIMEISFTEKKVIIEYDSFPLNEERMVDISETIVLEYMDVFLLSCRKIFKSLKEHKFEYSVSSTDASNIVEIIYPIVINKSVQKQEQVLDFTKYVNNIRKKK